MRGSRTESDTPRILACAVCESCTIQTCIALTMTAADMVAWLEMLALDGDVADAEPKALRLQPLHAPTRLVHDGRQRRLRLPKTWAWVDQIAAPSPGSPRSHHRTDSIRPHHPKTPGVPQPGSVSRPTLTSHPDQRLDPDPPARNAALKPCRERGRLASTRIHRCHNGFHGEHR